MEKILPTVSPIADAYAHIGAEFSIFMSNEKLYPWIINNFIQIYTLKDLPTHPERTGTLDFFYNQYGDWQMYHFSANPYIDYERITYSTINLLLQHISLIDLLIEEVNHDKYIFIPIDMYELPVYRAYHLRHRVHHLFVVGYNTEKRIFYAYDTFKSRQYVCKEIPFEDIERAYHQLISDPVVAAWSEIGGIALYRLYQNPWQLDKVELYSINLQTIIAGIKEYLMLPNCGQNYRHIDHYRYGIDCYIELHNWLKQGIAMEDCHVDHRAFSSMRDHKKVMRFRLQYLSDTFSLPLQEYIEKYDEFIHQLDIIITKIIKGNISKNCNQFLDCLSILDSVKDNEIDALNHLLYDLHNQ